MDPDEPFTCVDYGPASRLSRENYSYTPNIMDSLQDRERAQIRRLKWLNTNSPRFAAQNMLFVVTMLI